MAAGIDWKNDDLLVRVVGTVVRAQIEHHWNLARIDHVWITVDPGIGERVELAINTLSTRNRDAGFDARVRVGLAREAWDFLPPRGVETAAPFSYGTIEQQRNIFYEYFEREPLERLLLERAGTARLLEAVGAPYRRHRQYGLHQIHSRRASCAVTEDLRDHDGFLVFYFDDHRAERLYFKFCGQP